MFKKIVTTGGLAAVLLGAAASTPLAAQENLMQMIRADIRAEAQQLTAVAMQLSEEDAQEFWGIYRDYELERSKWTDARLALIKAYAEEYTTMSDEAAGEIMGKSFDLLRDRLDQYEEYYEEVEQALGASTAARAVQIERQLGLIIDLQLAHEIPLVFKADGN